MTTRPARDPSHRPELCTVEGCDARKSAKGLCKAHYARLRRHGDPEAEVQHGGTRQNELGYICSNGHIVDGDNVVYQDLRGKRFYRCRQCSNLKTRQWRERRRSAGVKPAPRARPQSRSVCIHGHEFTEGNTYYTGQGRRMCVTCRDAKPVTYDKCKYGHEFSPENTGYHSNGSRMCLTCLQRRRQEQYDRLKVRRQEARLRKRSRSAKISMPERVEVRVDDETLKAYREEASAISKVLSFDARHLLIKPRAREAWDNLRKSKQYGARNCADRESEFVDYKETPTHQQARILCDQCPALRLCAEFATLEKPMAGIYGGEVYDIDLDD